MAQLPQVTGSILLWASKDILYSKHKIFGYVWADTLKATETALVIIVLEIKVFKIKRSRHTRLVLVVLHMSSIQKIVCMAMI